MELAFYREKIVKKKKKNLSNFMMKVLVAQSYLTISDPMDCSPPGSSVDGILQARILEWVAIPFSRGVFLDQGTEPKSPALSGGFFTV